MNPGDRPPASQSALVAALERHLARGGQPVQCYDTHISWVLVAGSDACKIKKAISLDFLDCAPLAAMAGGRGSGLAANRGMEA